MQMLHDNYMNDKGVPSGPGFSLQVLATRSSWLRALHFNPSRMNINILRQQYWFLMNNPCIHQNQQQQCFHQPYPF